MNLQFRRNLPWLAAGVSFVLVSLGIGLSLTYIVQTGNTRPLLSHQGLVPFVTLSYALLGGLVASRHPGNVIGWLFAATAILQGLNAVAIGNTAFETLDQTTKLPWSEMLGWLGRWVWIPAIILPAVFAMLYFPYGQLQSRAGQLLAWLTGLALAVCVLSVALHPGPIDSWNIPTPNAYGIAGAEPVLESLLNGSAAVLVLVMLVSWLGVGLRFRRAGGVEREQLKWVVYTGGLLFVVLGLASVLAPLFVSEATAQELSIVLTELFILGIAGAVTIAIVRRRLYDIDLVIHRTLVYGALTAVVVGVYVLVVGGLGMLFQAQGNLLLSLAGVGIVAILAQPVRERLQRAVNRLMYGERDDPYTVLSRLGHRLEGTLAPEAVLPSIVETVAQTLKLPYAAIALANSDETFPVVAAYGTPTPEPLRLPLVFQAETLGHLIVGARAGDKLSKADLRLLDDLARQAGAAVRAVRLTADLQHSREQLVTAREEERRRLRRDLHDGLGSQFAALHLRADTLRGLIPKDPEAAEAVAVELRDEIRAAVADIRRLVYELRPPALDVLGLGGALRALATQQPSINGLQVTVEAPEPLPPLPAAVEVAAYRIAQEALTNVVRHAQARTCLIRLALADELRLEIQDDGIGLPANPAGGVGLRSMRERAAELGGTCTVQKSRDGGASVLACLPLPRARD